MCVGKNPFCRPSVPLRGARRATAGQFSKNFAKFIENYPHVPLVEKARRGFFDSLTPALSAGVFFVSYASEPMGSQGASSMTGVSSAALCRSVRYFLLTTT